MVLSIEVVCWIKLSDYRSYAKLSYVRACFNSAELYNIYEG